MLRGVPELADEDLSRRIVTAVTARSDSSPVEFFEVLPFTNAAHLYGAALVFMGHPKPIDCAECMQSMAYAKGEPLSRIACANCQYAQQQAESQKLQGDRSSHLPRISRCAECGKWCWTRTSLAIHRELHKAS